MPFRQALRSPLPRFCRWLIVGILACACVLAFAQAPEPVLKPGDTITVVVFSHEGYSSDYPVFEDGTINGPAFGRLSVKGLTLEGARKAIVARLSVKLKNPIVNVSLRSQRPDRIYIIGPEKGAGAMDLLPGTDVRKLVAAVSLPADPETLDVMLYRKGGETKRIDLWGVLQGKPDAWNGLLEPDDIVAFLPKPFVKVWFIGPFKAGGEIKIREGRDIYEALAQIGGADTAPLLADETYVLIRRGAQTLRMPFKKEPDKRGEVLQAGDVVMLDLPKVVKVSVGGEVKEAGEYDVREDLPLSKLILMAKGVAETGRLSNVLLFRGGDVVTLDATGPLTGQKPADFRLREGDFLWVQRNERFVYAFGEVNRPGKVMLKDGENKHLSDLLADAGGVSGNGTLRRITVLRPDSSGKYVANQYHLDEFIKDGNVKANPLLQSNDVVLFGQPKGLTLKTVAQILSGALLFETLFRTGTGR